MIKSFYTSSLLLDVLSVFGELSEEVSHQYGIPLYDPIGPIDYIVNTSTFLFQHINTFTLCECV